MSLKAKTFNGLKWSAVDLFGKRIIQFFIGIYLARLLSPAEFGMIGMILVFIEISKVFVNSGMGQALIRKKNISEEDYSTVFFFNFFVSICFFILLQLGAGSIAAFYETPEVEELLRVISLILVINSLVLVPKTQLIKDVNFKVVAQVGFFASLFSGLAAIYLASSGFGVWSLVWRSILTAILSMFGYYFINGWYPTTFFNKESFKSLFGFSWKLLASGLVSKFQSGAVPIIIGKMYSAESLGFYTRGDQYQKLFSENLYAIINRVTYPTLSLIQDDKEKVKNIYRRMLKASAFVIFPAMLTLVAVAEPFIIGLIGEKWRGSIIMLQLLSLASILFPLHSLNLNNLKVYGRSDIVLKLALFKGLLVIPVLFLGWYYNIEVMILGLIFNSIISYFINSFYSGKMIQYSSMSQLRDVFPIFIMASMSALAGYLLMNYLEILPLVKALFIAIISSVVYLVLNELYKDSIYLELKEMIVTKVRGVK